MHTATTKAPILAPWETLGVPAGLHRNHDGSWNRFSVRWDLDTNAPGMNGYTSAFRRFATAEEAIAAVGRGMGRAFCATAFDEMNKPLASRRNPKHHRNRRLHRK